MDGAKQCFCQYSNLCSVSITRPEHYVQAILCEVLFEFESQNVSSVYPQQKKTIWLASLLLEPQTLEKVWIIDVEREYRKLSYLFKILNGTMELSQKA